MQSSDISCSTNFPSRIPHRISERDKDYAPRFHPATALYHTASVTFARCIKFRAVIQWVVHAHPRQTLPTSCPGKGRASAVQWAVHVHPGLTPCLTVLMCRVHRSQAMQWAYQAHELPQFQGMNQPNLPGFYEQRQYMPPPPQQQQQQQLLQQQLQSAGFLNQWAQIQQMAQPPLQMESGHAAAPASPYAQGHEGMEMGSATPPTGSQVRLQQQQPPPPPPHAPPVAPAPAPLVHELENPDKPPPPTEKGCPMLPSARMYEAAGIEEDLEELMLVGGARFAKKREGVAVRLSAPGNKTFLKTSEVLQSVQAALTRKNVPLTLISEGVSGPMYGPYLLSMAAYAAQPLLEDETLKVFSGRDGVEAVEFEVHLLNTKGSKYKEEGTEAAVASQRAARNVQSAAARESRNARTFRLYLDYPDTHGNMDPEAQRRLEARIVQLATNHLTSHGAVEVGNAHTFDDQDYRLSKETMWVTHPENTSLLEFCRKSLPELKYFDVGEPQMAKAHLTKDTLDATGLKRCCFRPVCVPKEDGGQCGAASRAYSARGGARSGATERAKKLEQREQRSSDRGHERESRSSVIQQRVAAEQEKGQECRAYLKGRCTKQTGCERHTTAANTIMCCSSRKQGDPGFKPRLDKCPFNIASCPFKGHVD